MEHGARETVAFKWKSIVAHMHNTAANKKPLHQQHMGQRLRFARQARLTPLRLRGRQICGSGNDEDAAAADETAAEREATGRAEATSSSPTTALSS